jgi:hypothetical protein
MMLASLLKVAEVPVANEPVGLTARSLPFDDEDDATSKTDEPARSGRQLSGGLDVSLLRSSWAA